MKKQPNDTSVVQELCRKLKLQLEELAVVLEPPPSVKEEEVHRKQLMERLQRQLADLST